MLSIYKAFVLYYKLRIVIKLGIVVSKAKHLFSIY